LTEFEKVVEIRKKLQRTWQPFLARFGRLTPVQVATIPVILSGENALVCAPTATGKTEAIVAPLSELILEAEKDGLRCVYVSPTRALVNDLAERLTEPLREVDLDLGIWTGDHHRFSPHSPEQFLLTTPESLDSVLSRFSECFKTVRFAVFDELHLVDGTYRGDQLLILSKRLQAISESVKFYGLSATIKNPEEVASRYLGKATCIKVLGGREIREKIIDIRDIETGLSEVVKEFRKESISKALFFCNSRAETEEIGHKLQAHFEEDRVFVHHGSLPRERREATERAFKEMRFCFCVATMTLEVGIDIGDIDAVVLIGVPPSVSSLLQRIGRGSRRKPFTTVLAIAKSTGDKSMFEQLFNLAKKGELEDVVWTPCLSVAVQQILSISFQNKSRGVTPKEISNLMQWLGLEDNEVKSLLSHLEEKGYLVTQRGLVYPSTKTLDLANRGLIHSNIKNDKGYEVINSVTGEKLGEVGLLDAHLENLILGGKIWKTVQVTQSEILVKPGRPPAEALRFVRRGREGAFCSLLPSALRKKNVC
jgi:ATP-dependent Lhr-like helicase